MSIQHKGNTKKYLIEWIREGKGKEEGPGREGGWEKGRDRAVGRERAKSERTEEWGSEKGGSGEINLFFPSSDLPFASNEPVRDPEFPFPPINYPALSFRFWSSFFSPKANPSPRVIPCPAP